MDFLVSLLVLSFLIFFHELGHFLAARMFGVKVEVFSIGFGKKLFSFSSSKTEYRVSLIPLGGYVKMKGQDDTKPADVNTESDGYGSKTPLQKIIIILAGPFFNLALAAIIYFGLAMGGTDTLTARVGGISPNSAASMVDLKRGDKILSINGEKIRYWHEISKKIQKAGTSQISMTIARDGKITTLHLKPLVVETKNIFGENTKSYMIGITPLGEKVKVYYNPIEAASLAAEETYESTKLIAEGIEKLITGAVSLNNVGGVISIMQTTNEATHSGFVPLLLLTALISVNLGVFNLLPIPALDGGHIIFNLYEMIFKKMPSEAVFNKLTLVGWTVLLWLTFLGLYNDLNRITGGF